MNHVSTASVFVTLNVTMRKLVSKIQNHITRIVPELFGKWLFFENGARRRHLSAQHHSSEVSEKIKRSFYCTQESTASRGELDAFPIFLIKGMCPLLPPERRFHPEAGFLHRDAGQRKGCFGNILVYNEEPTTCFALWFRVNSLHKRLSLPHVDFTPF